ncbi:MAG: transcriptional repressor NrdR [Bdellovibrionales bacterium]|nr:transcriptional repressor NrdR [Bdellovibrionales bacterium]
MKCPNCGHLQNKVIETRVQKEGEIRRRRECSSCRGRYNTLECVVIQLPFIVKKDGRREPFNREKLARGVQLACKKRPVSLSEIESLVNRISKWAQNRSTKELGAQHLGQRVIDELKNLDDVAYVRFASVYKTFTDVQEFVQTLKTDDKTGKVIKQ